MPLSVSFAPDQQKNFVAEGYTVRKHKKLTKAFLFVIIGTL
jgi:hypothetical protein